MTIKYDCPASIECEESNLKSRKIIPLQPVKNTSMEIRSKLLYPFKLDRNSEAYIKKELVPKKAIINDDSMLNFEDGIKGDMISGFSGTLINKNRIKVEKGSSTHKAQFLILKEFVYAKLEKSYKAIEDKETSQLR